MEENFDIPVDNEESFDELLHYGTKYHSGRYPYGSGEDPYDDSQFIDSGTKELHFHDSDAVYLDFLRHISPYNGNTYDIGSEKYKWRNLYLDGYIMVGDKKFLLYADGSTARLRLVT